MAFGKNRAISDVRDPRDLALLRPPVRELTENELARLMELAAQRKIVVPAHICARLPRQRKHCCPCRRPLLGRHPPGSDRRACGGASIAMGDADCRGRKRLPESN